MEEIMRALNFSVALKFLHQNGGFCVFGRKLCDKIYVSDRLYFLFFFEGGTCPLLLSVTTPVATQTYHSSSAV